MANETPITIIGNTTSEPELRFLPNGQAVANVDVAVTPRKFNRQTNEWEDGITAFWRLSIWREQAEHVAETIQKGMRVIVSGVIKTEEWEDKNGGGKRSRQVIDVDEIGPSLKYATAQVRKASKGDGQGGGFGGGQQGGGRPQGRPQGQNRPQGQGRPQQGGGGQRGGRNQYAPAAGNETWQGGQQGGNYDWSAGGEDEPPF